ncbi:MAG: hypothetical protein ABR525_11545 [Candidatus Limnocylindria bacterium]
MSERQHDEIDYRAFALRLTQFVVAGIAFFAVYGFFVRGNP